MQPYTHPSPVTPVLPESISNLCHSILYHVTQVEEMTKLGEMRRAEYHAYEIGEKGALLRNAIYWAERRSGTVT